MLKKIKEIKLSDKDKIKLADKTLRKIIGYDCMMELAKPLWFQEIIRLAKDTVDKLNE